MHSKHFTLGFSLLALFLVPAFLPAAAPQVIPELQAWQDAADGGCFRLVPGTRLLLPADASAALKETAAVVAGELGLTVAADAPDAAGIALRLDPAAGGPEAYRLTVTPHRICIAGATERAVFWGTRTLRQVFAAQNGTFPCGTASDAPAYPSRGFMFDCGRKPFTLTTLRAIVDLCAYYKMNELQLHLSDNYIWLHKYPAKTPEELLRYEPSPSAFRLESKVPGLTSPVLSYTKEEFRELTAYARRRGVTLIPELDVPGHAMALVRVRPDLMYRGSVGGKKDIERVAMLDLTKEATFDFVTGLFDEYLDSGVFSGPVVHIGTDEYYGDNESYRRFTDRLLRHLLAKGKTPRLWGSFSYKRGQTPVVADGVQMDIWNVGWQHPGEALKMGYPIVNIVDSFTYSVPNGNGNLGGYGDDINARVLYESWAPHVFSNTLTLKPREPKLLGGAWAMWCDHSFMGDPGLTARDLLDRIRRNCAVVGRKCWNDAAPTVPYDGFLKTLARNGSPVVTEPPRWKQTYTVRRTDDRPLKLAESDDTDLYAVLPKTGRVGYRSEGAFFTFDYTLPKDRAVTLTFVAEPRTFRLLADGLPVGGTPKREYFPESCRFFSVAEPAAVPAAAPDAPAAAPVAPAAAPAASAAPVRLVPAVRRKSCRPATLRHHRAGHTCW